MKLCHAYPKMNIFVTLTVLLSSSGVWVSSVFGNTSTTLPESVRDSGGVEGAFSSYLSDTVGEPVAKTLKPIIAEVAAHLRSGTGIGTLLSNVINSGLKHPLPGSPESQNWEELINLTHRFQPDFQPGPGFKRSEEKSGGRTPLEELSRKLLRETGGDNGLLDVIDEIQKGADGLTNIEEIAQIFSRLSDSMESRGTSIDTLMDAFLDTPLAVTDPLEIPKDMKVLYHKYETSHEAKISGDASHTQFRRTGMRNSVDPPFVASSVIKNHMDTLYQSLPSPTENAHCHALILAGGSATAPLQAGAILGLAEQYKANDMALRWDVIAAVNKAAISAAAGTLFPPG